PPEDQITSRTGPIRSSARVGEISGSTTARGRGTYRGEPLAARPSPRRNSAVTFDEFVNAELDGLISFAAALAGDRYLAEDILSDALVKVALQWRRISAADNPTAYVRRMVVTTYLADRRKARRRRTEPTSDLSVLDYPTADQTDAILARQEVAGLLARLPPQQKAVIVLRYLLDEPDDEIARA